MLSGNARTPAGESVSRVPLTGQSAATVSKPGTHSNGVFVATPDEITGMNGDGGGSPLSKKKKKNQAAGLVASAGPAVPVLPTTTTEQKESINLLTLFNTSEPLPLFSDLREARTSSTTSRSDLPRDLPHDLPRGTPSRVVESSKHRAKSPLPTRPPHGPPSSPIGVAAKPQQGPTHGSTAFLTRRGVDTISTGVVVDLADNLAEYADYWLDLLRIQRLADTGR